MEKKTVVEITVLRHSLSEQRSEGATDGERKLTPKGRDLAEARRICLGYPQFDLVFYSPALRAKETALIVSGLSQDDPKVIEIPELCNMDCPPEISKRINELFAKLGDAPLEEFYKEENISEALAFMSALAIRALETMVEKIGCEPSLLDKEVIQVMVVGHAVSMMMLGSLMSAKADLFKVMVARECEGFSVIIPVNDGGKIEVETIKD